MDQSPSWKANSSSASQEIPRILLNRVPTSPAPVPILRQINPVYVSSAYCFTINFNIILPSTPGSSKWYLPLMFPHQNPICTFPLPHTCYVPRPSHSSWFDHTNNIWWSVQIMNLLIVRFPPLPCQLHPSMSQISPQRPILEHPQPMLVPQNERPSFTSI